MDIKLTLGYAVQKGLVHYIADYITKRGLSTYLILSTIEAALSKIEQEKEAGKLASPDIHELSRIPSMKCLNKLTGESENICSGNHVKFAETS